jgi:hypothetical protein
MFRKNHASAIPRLRDRQLFSIKAMVVPWFMHPISSRFPHPATQARVKNAPAA